MSRVFSTSTMNSPPLDVCVTGSCAGGMVSAAVSCGPGTAALRSGRGAAARVSAASAGVNAAAPTRVAPLRKLRRPATGRSRFRFDIGSSLERRLRFTPCARSQSAPVRRPRGSARAPLPKFVTHRGTPSHELRKQRGTRKHMILVPLFDLKFLNELAAGGGGNSNMRHEGGGRGGGLGVGGPARRFEFYPIFYVPFAVLCEWRAFV